MSAPADSLEIKPSAIMSLRLDAGLVTLRLKSGHVITWRSSKGARQTWLPSGGVVADTVCDVTDLATATLASGRQVSSADSVAMLIERDAMLAVEAMGHKPSEAKRRVLAARQQLGDSATVEDLTARALQ